MRTPKKMTLAGIKRHITLSLVTVYSSLRQQTANMVSVYREEPDESGDRYTGYGLVLEMSLLVSSPTVRNVNVGQLSLPTTPEMFA